MKPVTPRVAALLTEPELRALLERYRRENWRGIQTAEWQARIVEQTVEDNGEATFDQLAGVWSFPENATILDIGSGVGAFVIACHRRGLRAYGIEPDRIGQGGSITAIQIASRRTEHQVFTVATGEVLPFSERSFDLVTMNQVMEHVSDQKAVLREAARVLKPGGAIYVACPNYLRFYEPHYKIFWFPLLPKTLGRLYLRVRGRSPALLNQITYTTNSRLRALAGGLGSQYATIDLHREKFLEKCEHGSFLSLRARIVGRMAKLPVIGRATTWAALRFLSWTEGGVEMIVVRKKEEQSELGRARLSVGP
jgi:2-polyprenyl-3-methyl-5-hydroxy-6-metoxy-1,4-benzoquinol methylase